MRRAQAVSDRGGGGRGDERHTEEYEERESNSDADLESVGERTEGSSRDSSEDAQSPDSVKIEDDEEDGA